MPCIIVQVKHHPTNPISLGDVQQLGGAMKRPTDVGIFATSGTFSKPAKREARESEKHIELIDFVRLKSLWQEYFAQMTDEQKELLPLHPIYFLDSND
ncbi:MAG: restriction endonuclease [Flavobacteriales bacterium]|nr:restriction endonuclease [Flavobacteriales bacterium]